MAERTHDLADVLRAAESQREGSLAGTPTDAVLEHVHAAARVRRTRRTAAAVALVAAVAALVVVTGAIVRSPRAATLPAGPSPTTSAASDVRGLPPLPTASEEDLRTAPAGSVLALWASADGDAFDRDQGATGTSLLLVRPDGAVLRVGPAPAGAVRLGAWDRVAGTVVTGTLGEGGARDPLVDVLTGRVVGDAPRADEPGAPAPDGTRRARTEDGVLRVGEGDAVVTHALPAAPCRLVGWADDTRVLLDCPALDPVTLRASGDAGASSVLVDVASGAVVDHRPVPPAGLRPVPPSVRTADGRLVAVLEPAGAERDTACGVPLAAVTGLDVSVVAEVPAARLGAPGPVVAGDRLLVAGSTACDGGPPAQALWDVPLDGRAPRTLLPAASGPDAPVGLLSWTVAAGPPAG